MTASRAYRPYSGGMNSYLHRIYDPQTGAVFGRKDRNWGKLLLFYAIFYTALASFTFLLVVLFYLTLDPRIPKWKTTKSVIGTNPGLGFRPMPLDNIHSTLIWFEVASNNETKYKKWFNNLKSYLDQYYTPGKLTKGTASTRKCTFENLPLAGEVCNVDVTLWEDCSRERYFNYHLNRPCIFLKLNRIYGWIPEYYNDTNNLPPNMPLQLKYHIANTPDSQRNVVWVSCEGENPADVEYLGPISYYPRLQGFPGYYFPYKNGEGYLSPLVAVQFTEPLSGIVMNVECKAWAKNIKHSRLERTGLSHFELLID